MISISVAWWVASNAAAGSTPSDPFRGWEGSRWLIEIEETTPGPIELSAEDNKSFRTRAVQLQAVLACPTASRFGKKSAEIDCRVESIAIRATPRSTDPGEATNPDNLRVLVDMGARLQAGLLRITASTDGRITTVDLPNLQASNRRESESREVLRRLMFDAVSGFHLKRPDDWQTLGAWTEKNTALLRAPTEPASVGQSKTEHTVSTVDGITVIQSTGDGTFAAPYIPWEYSYDGQFAQHGTSSGGPGARASMGNLGGGAASAANDGRMVGAGTAPLASTPTDRTFAATLTSVAVMDEANGMASERVWAMLGRATASSLGNMQGMSLYYAGRVRRLGETESVEIGLTEVVAPPGQQVPGLNPWTPIATF